MFNRVKEESRGVHCASCGSPIRDATVCSCGMATPNMSFAERTAYELELYKAYKARVASA